MAVKAPPVGAVESDCAVKVVPEPVTLAPLVAVTEPVPVGEAAVNVNAPAVLPQPLPAIAP